jgi:hypothetical protein
MKKNMIGSNPDVSIKKSHTRMKSVLLRFHRKSDK